MKKSLLKVSLILVYFLLTNHVSVNSQSNDLTNALHVADEWLKAQQHFDNLPGIVTGVVKDQRLVWAQGYGFSNVEGKVAAKTNTVFSICSISKLFTSIAIMQLYEAGKIRLDDSIQTYLPDFKLKNKVEDAGPITIRSLLTHSSGLQRESNHPYWTGPDFQFPSQKQLRDGLDELHSIYSPNSYFQYSNLGMALLGEIIVSVTKQPYEQYIEDNILKPLKLSDTHPFIQPEKWGSKMAIGYSAVKRDGSREKVALFDGKGMTAAMGFTSTAEDLAKFASWQFRLLGEGNPEVLKQSTLKEMQRVQWIDPDWKTSWGLGFIIQSVDGKTLVGHDGSCPGYKTTLIMEPKDKTAYIAMINGGAENPDKYANQIRNLLNKAMTEKPLKSDSLNLIQYEGFYNDQPWVSESRIFAWYGKLAIFRFPTDDLVGGMTLLKHVKGDTFRRVRRDGSLGEEVLFERDKNGKVTRYLQHNNYSEKIIGK
jgi:CubicO group peptidase (beta-lactamase class C family)